MLVDITIKQRSSGGVSAARWPPEFVLHAGAWLTPQEFITFINVFRFIINC